MPCVGIPRTQPKEQHIRKSRRKNVDPISEEELDNIVEKIRNNSKVRFDKVIGFTLKYVLLL